MPKLEPTKETLALAHALRDRGVVVELEHWDGHKHVDIFIPAAKLYIEIDGIQHFTNPKQILTDFKRDHYSDDGSFFTKRFSNEMITHHLDEIADAVTEIASIGH
jgi:very-short-patch-repair endonuclease